MGREREREPVFLDRSLDESLPHRCFARICRVPALPTGTWALDYQDPDIADQDPDIDDGDLAAALRWEREIAIARDGGGKNRR